MAIYFAEKYTPNVHWDDELGRHVGYDIYLSNSNTDYDYTWTELSEWNNTPCYRNYVKKLFLTEEPWWNPQTQMMDDSHVFLLDIPNSNCSGLFKGCLNETIPDLDKVRVNYSTTCLSEMFRDCPNLKSVDCSGWYTDEILAIDYMFADCPNLEEINICNWSSYGKIWACSYCFANDVNLHTIKVEEGLNWSNVMDWSGWEHRFNDIFDNCPSLPDWDESRTDIYYANDSLPWEDEWGNGSYGGYFRHDYVWRNFEVYEKYEDTWKKANVKQKDNGWKDATPRMLEY